MIRYESVTVQQLQDANLIQDNELQCLRNIGASDSEIKALVGARDEFESSIVGDDVDMPRLEALKGFADAIGETWDSSRKTNNYEEMLVDEVQTAHTKFKSYCAGEELDAPTYNQTLEEVAHLQADGVIEALKGDDVLGRLCQRDLVMTVLEDAEVRSRGIELATRNAGSPVADDPAEDSLASLSGPAAASPQANPSSAKEGLTSVSEWSAQQREALVGSTNPSRFVDFVDRFELTSARVEEVLGLIERGYRASDVWSTIGKSDSFDAAITKLLESGVESAGSTSTALAKLSDLSNEQVGRIGVSTTELSLWIKSNGVTEDQVTDLVHVTAKESGQGLGRSIIRLHQGDDERGKEGRSWDGIMVSVSAAEELTDIEGATLIENELRRKLTREQLAKLQNDSSLLSLEIIDDFREWFGGSFDNADLSDRLIDAAAVVAFEEGLVERESIEGGDIKKPKLAKALEHLLEFARTAQYIPDPHDIEEVLDRYRETYSEDNFDDED